MYRVVCTSTFNTQLENIFICCSPSGIPMLDTIFKLTIISLLSVLLISGRGLNPRSRLGDDGDVDMGGDQEAGSSKQRL